MKHILEKYETMSGQSISLGKSSVVSSPNTRNINRNQVCNILHVKEATTLGNYLGMPMFVGRRKNKAFRFLTERVSQKFQVWRKKAMSY